MCDRQYDADLIERIMRGQCPESIICRVRDGRCYYHDPVTPAQGKVATEGILAAFAAHPLAAKR